MKTRQNNSGGEQGFTLIELLVVTTLLSVISISVFSVFSQSVTLWGRARSEALDLSSRIFIEKLTRDLTNAAYLSNIPFIGTSQSLSFASTASGPGREQKGGDGPREIQYIYAAKEARILKREKNYISTLVPEKKGKKSKDSQMHPAFEKVTGVEFQFYDRDAEPGERWSKIWNQECLPHAVQVKFHYREARRSEVRIIDIPQGGCP